MDMSPLNESHANPRQVQADDDAAPRSGDELVQAEEVAPGAYMPSPMEGLTEYLYDSDGKTWRLIDGEYYCISSDADDNETEDYDPLASALLMQRPIAQFKRH